MIFPNSEISRHLNNLGLASADTVMIHANSGIAGQYIFDDSSNPLPSFIDILLSYFDKGTVIVPCFTYSATENEIFDLDKTPSKIGKFSETFRLIDGVKRSCHPIFSVSCFGVHADYYKDSLITDCFGKDTLFDKLYINNVKILTLGCSLNRITFTHYVEQNLDVSYRYFKNFRALIKNKDKEIIEEVNVKYFVRDLNSDTTLDLKLLENKAIQDKKLIKKPFGRFLARLILAKDFFSEAVELVKKNEYALIKKEI